MKITKQDKPKEKAIRPIWISILDWAFLIILCIIIIQAQIDGHFIRKTEIRTCQGKLTDCQGDDKICPI